MTIADPSGPSALLAATRWLEATVLGTVATTVAVICVAWIGVMMLSGRVNVRHGITTIIGCFLVFGATSISAGVRCAAQGGECGSSETLLAQAGPAPSPLEGVQSPAGPLPAPVQRDPYAGASIIR